MKLLKLFAKTRTAREWDDLLQDLLTSKERASIAERLQLVKLLAKGIPQREVAKKLGVSISKVTRGSKALQEGRGIFRALRNRGIDL